MLRKRFLLSVLLVLATAPVLAGNSHNGKVALELTYCAQDLGTPPDQPAGEAGNLVIFGMNYRKQIVGTYAVGGRSRAYLWEPSRGFTILGTLPGHDTAEANAINHAGVVVGTSGDYESGQHNSFIWDRRNGMRLLDASLGGNRDGATDINARGEVTGASTVDSTDFVQHGYFRARDGDVFDIGTLSGGNAATVGSALNNRGEVVGADSGPGFSQAFIWDKYRGLRPLTAQPERTSLLPHDINDFGVVVGALFASNGATRGFRFTRRSGLQDLGSLGGGEMDTVEAYAINLWGTIVGTSQDANLAGRAFIWSERQGMRSLTDLVDPGSAVKPLLGVGKAINEFGVIAAEGVSETTGRGFLLTPRFHSRSPACDQRR